MRPSGANSAIVGYKGDSDAVWNNDAIVGLGIWVRMRMLLVYGRGRVCIGGRMRIWWNDAGSCSGGDLVSKGTVGAMGEVGLLRVAVL